VVGRWVTLERERRQAAREGRPNPRELEAANTAPSRRVRELEKENELLGKARAFFASRHHNTSALS
jgi:transposase-like protein